MLCVNMCLRRYEVRDEVVPDGLLSVLEISSVQASDFAVYNCSAYTGNDSTHLPIKFSKQGSSVGFRTCISVCLVAY